jgi:hypothetical protein
MHLNKSGIQQALVRQMNIKMIFRKSQGLVGKDDRRPLRRIQAHAIQESAYRAKPHLLLQLYWSQKEE